MIQDAQAPSSMSWNEELPTADVAFEKVQLFGKVRADNHAVTGGNHRFSFFYLPAFSTSMQSFHFDSIATDYKLQTQRSGYRATGYRFRSRSEGD